MIDINRIPLIDSDGKIVAILSTFEEITDRKVAEERLQKSEERYKNLSNKLKNLMEAIPIGISISNPEGAIEEINTQAYKIFGYDSKEEFLKIAAITHYANPRDREKFVELLEKGSVKDFEVQFKRKDGTKFWGALTSMAQKIDDQTVYINTFQDITDRKKAEEEIINLAKFPEENPNPVLRVSKEFVLYANRAGQCLFNMEIGNRIPTLLRDVINRAFEENVTQNLEVAVKHHFYSIFVTSIKGTHYANVYGMDITKRKKTTKKLRESEEKYREFYEDAPNAYFLIEPDQTIKNCNKAAEKLLGYSKDELLNLRVIDLYTDNEEGKIKAQSLFQRFINGGRIQDEELQMKNKNGKPLWISLTVNPVMNKQGQIIESHSMVIDITERKRAEQKLKESEERFKYLLSSSPVIIYTSKSSGDYGATFISTNVKEKWGYDSQNFLNDSNFWLDHIHPDDKENILTVLSELIEKEHIIFNYRFKLNHGIYQWMRDEVQLVKDNNGNPIEIIGSVIDITDRIDTEQKFKESELKYRNLVETSSMGLLEIDIKKGNVIYINPRLLEIVGYNQDELMGNGMFIKAIYPDDHKKLTKIDEDKDIELRIFNKEGKIKWLSGRTLHHYNEQGELIYLRLWLQDITEAKELEEIKSNLLTRISHEINTPLISIKGFTDLLLTEYKSGLNKQIISFLERIKEGSERLKLLVNRFLETTQLDVGLVELNKSNENLSTMIKEGINDVEGLIKLRNHTITLDIPDELLVSIDKEKIQSVISNLLTNAVKFTPVGGNITIKSRNNNNSLIISIRDDGIGFQKEEIAYLFKPFGKIEKYGRGWNIISEGIGLGLFLSKEIIELHKGKIWAESPGLNKGSTFYFSIPIIRNNNN